MPLCSKIVRPRPADNVEGQADREE